MSKSILSYIIVCLCILLPKSVSCQDNPDFIDAEPINSHRYRNVRGGPYMFDEWQIGVIYSSNLTIYANVEFNYNGESQKLEVKKDNKIFELNPESYLRAEILTGEVDAFGNIEKVVLQRGVHARFEQDFVRVVYQGRRIILVEKFESKIDETSSKQIGDKESFKLILKKRTYFLKHHTSMKPIRLEQKSITKALGHAEEVTSLVAEKELDLINEKDMRILLKWYEDKGYVR